MEGQRTQYDATVTIQLRIHNAETHLGNVPVEKEVEEQLRERIGTQFNRGQVDVSFNSVAVTNERPISKSMGASR